MKILFVNPFGIGDVLFTTALIRPLEERGDSVYYWCNERVVDILKHNKAVESIFALSRGDLKRAFKKSPIQAVKKVFSLINRLKKERFDMALDFSLDYRYSLLLRFLRVKKIAGFDYKGRGRFLTDRIKITCFDGRHMVDHYAQLLKFVDKSIAAPDQTELFIGDEEKDWAGDFLSRHKVSASDVLVGIAPGGGASWGEGAFRKHWPKEKFAAVADKLMSADNYKFLLLGSESEKEICGYICDRMKDNATNICGAATLGQSAALLARCRLLIANDGGPLHMASALGVKTVSIFGPVDEKVYGPYPLSKDHIVLTNDVACRPCYKSFKYPLCGDRVCLDSLEPSLVTEAAKDRLRT